MFLGYHLRDMVLDATLAGLMLPEAKPQFPDVGWEGQVTGGTGC